MNAKSYEGKVVRTESGEQLEVLAVASKVYVGCENEFGEFSVSAVSLADFEIAILSHKWTTAHLAV